ncbi:MAG TPA: hypothetical protein VIZ65_16580 [Cellvibrionaceae bacterium]
MEQLSLSQFDGKKLDGLVFCSTAYSFLEKIRSFPGGLSSLRMRKTKAEKKLLEEILPICKYIQYKYRAGLYISVCWSSGNQNFDAETIQKGFYVEKGFYPKNGFLEVTCAVHPNDYLHRELIDAGGISFGPGTLIRANDKTIHGAPIYYSGHEFIDDFSAIVLKAIAKKSAVPTRYPPNTTLIVACSLNRLYSHHEWQKLIEKIQSVLPENNFSELFIYDQAQEYIASL